MASGLICWNVNVGRKVEVQCVDNTLKTGFLYTKDPLTNAVVLVNRIQLCEKEKSPCSKQEFGTSENDIGQEDPTNGLKKDDRAGCEDSECKHWHLRFEIIMGDAFRLIKEIHGSADFDIWTTIDTSIKQIFVKRDAMKVQYEAGDLRSKMDVLVEFLKSHHLPVLVENDTIILFDGLAKIEPPYNVASCISRNPIVLDKVQKLVEKCRKN